MVRRADGRFDFYVAVNGRNDAYPAGTNTRRVRRALASLFGGAVGKDTVSRVWRKVKSDWDAWNARSLAIEPTRRVLLQGRPGAPAG